MLYQDLQQEVQDKVNSPEGRLALLAILRNSPVYVNKFKDWSSCFLYADKKASTLHDTCRSIEGHLSKAIANGRICQVTSYQRVDIEEKQKELRTLIAECRRHDTSRWYTEEEKNPSGVDLSKLERGDPGYPLYLQVYVPKNDPPRSEHPYRSQQKYIVQSGNTSAEVDATRLVRSLHSLHVWDVSERNASRPTVKRMENPCGEVGLEDWKNIRPSGSPLRPPCSTSSEGDNQPSVREVYLDRTNLLDDRLEQLAPPKRPLDGRAPLSGVSWSTD